MMNIHKNFTLVYLLDNPGIPPANDFITMAGYQTPHSHSHSHNNGQQQNNTYVINMQGQGMYSGCILFCRFSTDF